MWGAAKLAIWPHVLRAPPCPVDSGPSTLCASPLGPASLTQRKNYLDEQLNPSPQPGNGGSWTERRGEEEPLAWGRFPFLWKMTGGPSWRGLSRRAAAGICTCTVISSTEDEILFLTNTCLHPTSGFYFCTSKISCYTIMIEEGNTSRHLMSTCWMPGFRQR